MASHKNTLLVYGGNGAVGSGCVTYFKIKGWKVISIASWKLKGPEETPEHEVGQCEKVCHVIRHKNNKIYNINMDAEVNILVHKEKTLKEQHDAILEELSNDLKDRRLDAIICAAGAFEMGGLEDNLAENCELMWKQNVWPSIITAAIAKKFLSREGLVCFSGASAAMEGTPKAVAYGLAKAAVHQLTQSLAVSDGELPGNSLCVAILPITIDTLINRQMMPDSDVSAWTPTKYIVELLYTWSMGKNRPNNGCLVQFVTKNFNTDIFFL